MIIEDVLEEVLKDQLQKKLEFELNGKIFKRGKFVLYRMETYSNNYEITFIFDKSTSDRVESFKIPYPFGYEYYPEDGHIFFDYRLISLTKNSKLEARLRELADENYTASKFFDKILKIHCSIPA